MSALAIFRAIFYLLLAMVFWGGFASVSLAQRTPDPGSYSVGGCSIAAGNCSCTPYIRNYGNDCGANMGVVDRYATSNGVVGVTPPANFSGVCQVRLQPRGKCWFTNSPQSVTAGGGVNLTFGQNSDGCGGNQCGGPDCVAQIYVTQPSQPSPPPPPPKYTVSGIVFGDVNRNGIQDSGDENLCSATVYLQNSSGATIGAYEIQPQNPGYYSFPGITQDTYRTYHPVPVGWVNTTPYTYGFYLNSDQTYNFGLWTAPTPPMPFTQNQPVPVCTGVGQGIYNLSWTTSFEADYYKVIAQSNLRGWQPEINVGNVTGYRFAVPPGGAPDEGWEFTIVAVNSTGSRVANDNLSPYHSSYYLYGWTTINCTAMAPPSVYGSATCSGTNSPVSDIWWGLPAASDNIIVTRTDMGFNSLIGNIPSWTVWRETSAKTNQSGYGYWVYYHNPTNQTDQSGRGFGAGWSPPGYIELTMPDCSPPGAFSHLPFNAFCASAMDPRINIAWTASAKATSYSITPQSAIRGWFPQINLGNVTIYQYDVPDGFWLNEGFDFTTAAYNSFGATGTSGGSSYYTQPGWTIIPACYPPQQFSFSQNPVPRCGGLNDSKIDLAWSASAFASYYEIIPVSNFRGAQPSINVGNNISYTYSIPPGNPNAEQWTFTIVAYNSWGYRLINNNYSPWVTMANCASPQAGFTSGGQQFQLTVNSGSTVALLSTVYNADICSITPEPGWGLASNPTGFTLSPWGPVNTTSETLPLNNDQSKPPASHLYTFTLMCTNSALSLVNPVSAVISKSFNVNVVPKLAPYIKTTEGDVHTNQDINVAR